MKTKIFVCENCNVEFKIEVEPNYSEWVLEKYLWRDFEWLKKVIYCPVCGKKINN